MGRVPLPGAALVGEAAETDPACGKSPFHAKIEALATAEAATTAPPDYVYRGPAQPARQVEEIS